MAESAPKRGDEPEVAKQPYAKPELTIYGDLRLSTFTRSSGSHNDGGTHPNHKTG